MTRRWAPPTRYTLRRNTASIMKGLVWRLINQKINIKAWKICFFF